MPGEDLRRRSDGEDAALGRSGLPGVGPVGKLTLGMEIARTYLHVRWLLARRDLPSVLERLRMQSGSGLVQPHGDEFVRRGRRLARRVSRTLDMLPGDSRCLVQSCVLVALLARRGIEGILVLGVRTQPYFEAHAWVEVAGEPLLNPGPWRDRRLAEY